MAFCDTLERYFLVRQGAGIGLNLGGRSDLDNKSLRRAIEERRRLVVLTTGREDRAGVYEFHRLPLTRYPLPPVIVKDNEAKKEVSGSSEERENLRIWRDLVALRQDAHTLYLAVLKAAACDKKKKKSFR